MSDDVLCVGCQAEGTSGRQSQHVGQRNCYVEFDGERYDIRAQVHTIGGYSTHADQSGLLRFVSRMSAWPNEIRPVHGEKPARRALAGALRERYVDQSSDVDILLPGIDEETGMG
ncbi:MBL fold metallo-hydrolase RNA specificity domain-containing protein [Pseudomonas sp. 8O]|uniref:MBL fold metallo-hydrolase RNA specificity domain-containing protein n=1 Tax=Pseudomonas sp. 8O TaxID=2653165 RepID=UPI0012F2FAD5